MHDECQLWHTSEAPRLRVVSCSVACCEGTPSPFMTDFAALSLRLLDTGEECGRLGTVSCATELGPASATNAAAALVTRAVSSCCAGDRSPNFALLLPALLGRLSLLSCSLICKDRSLDRLRERRVSGIMDGNGCHYTQVCIPVRMPGTLNRTLQDYLALLHRVPSPPLDALPRIQKRFKLIKIIRSPTYRNSQKKSCSDPPQPSDPLIGYAFNLIHGSSE